MPGKSQERYPRGGYVESPEEKRRKRMKFAAYISAFVVFQTLVILVFVLVIMHVHRPKFRLGTLQIKTLTTSQTSPSFDMKLVAPIRVKNKNFGPYKYDPTTVDFTYGGVKVGQVSIPEGKAGFQSTKKFDVDVALNYKALPSNSKLGSDLKSGVLNLSSQGKMNGVVKMIYIFKKKKSTDMNCTMTIDVSAKAVKSLSCK